MHICAQVWCVFGGRREEFHILSEDGRFHYWTKPGGGMRAHHCKFFFSFFGEKKKSREKCAQGAGDTGHSRHTLTNACAAQFFLHVNEVLWFVSQWLTELE